MDFGLAEILKTRTNQNLHLDSQLVILANWPLDFDNHKVALPTKKANLVSAHARVFFVKFPAFYIYCA